MTDDVLPALIAVTIGVVGMGLRQLRETRRRRDLRRFLEWSRADAPIDVGVRRRARLSTGACALSVACCAFAASRGFLNPDHAAGGVEGTELLILVDTSKSMYAADVLPTRLGAVVAALEPLVKTSAVSRVGIIGFAGDVALVCPLTTDRASASSWLRDLERHPIGGRGSAVARALDRALEAFGSSARERLILLVTDGEDTAGGLDDSLARARNMRVRIHAVTVGTAEGAPVPAIREGIDIRPERSDVRASLHTALREEQVARLAAETGGTYRRLQDGAFAAADLVSSLNGSSSSGWWRSPKMTLTRIALITALFFLLIDDGHRV